MISFIVSSAIFGTTNLSSSLKVLISLVLSMLVYPTLYSKNLLGHFAMENLVLACLQELSIGLTLGFMTRFFFMVISMAGDFISISIGLGSAQLFNPAMGSTGNVVEQFYSLLGMLLFLTLDGHHQIISALVNSFEIIKIGIIRFNFSALKELVILLQDLLLITIRIASPILVTSLIINASMAVLGRVVPQINVQVTTVPVTLLIGFGVMFVCLPILVGLMTQTIDFSLFKIFQFLKAV